MDKLHLMAEGLIKYETIDAKQITEIMAGKEPSPPDDWEALKAIHKESVNDDKDDGIDEPMKSTDDPAKEH